MHLVSGKTLEEWNVLSDEQVVARVRTGQTALFEVLMRRYNQRLYRVARTILGDDQEAEHAMEDAYVTTYAQLTQCDGRIPFATWLTQILITQALARVPSRPAEGHPARLRRLRLEDGALFRTRAFQIAADDRRRLAHRPPIMTGFSA
jgi:DNA-directed RNA polymerase specialized sigma24 family protein